MKRVVLLVMIVVLAPILAAPTTQAQDDQLLIVASTTIIADVVGNVAGDAADVAALVGHGQDPHAYTPSGADIVLLDEADIVFVNGANLEEGLLPIFEEAADGNLYEISACAKILPFEFALGHHHEGEEHEHEEDEHEEHEEDEHMHGELAQHCHAIYEEIEALLGHEDEEHDHDEYLGFLVELDCGLGHEHEEGEHTHEAGSCDPHVWTDPVNVMAWTLHARDVLSELDPDNAGTYAANASAYLGELITLHNELEEGFAALDEDERVLVTNHGAFGYMAYRYELQVVGTVIPGGSTGAEPSPQDVVALIEVIEDYGVSVIFTENTVSDTLASQIADETGAVVFKLYTGSLTAPDGDAPTYLDYMRFNAANLMAGMSR